VEEEEDDMEERTIRKVKTARVLRRRPSGSSSTKWVLASKRVMDSKQAQVFRDSCDSSDEEGKRQ
jgi:hypothetical protein